MNKLVHDTAFAHLVRLVAGSRALSYMEEGTPEIQDFYRENKESSTQSHSGSDRNTPSQSQIEEGNNARAKAVASLQASPPGPVSEDDKRIIVSWYSDEDPENPQNWPFWKKCLVTSQLCLLTTSVYIGSSIYSAGTANVMEIFGVGQVAATLGLSLFVAGYGTGPMIWSPMSEVPQIGRNIIYLATLVVFVALQVPVALASNFGMLLAFRFLTGFFGSPVLATGGASIADIWSPAKRAYSMSIWGLAAVCGPTLGPLVGGYAVEYGPVGGAISAPWTWPIWELMWMSALCLVSLFFLFPETSSQNILFRRARRLRKLTGNPNLVSQSELAAADMTARDILMTALVRPFTLNFTEPMVFLLNLYIALIYGLLYVWFESFVFVFIGIYGFTIGQEGLAYLGILVGAILVIPPYFAYLKYMLEPQFDENGDIQPEKRLPPTFVGAFCIPICLFWFGWSSRESIHWIVPIIGSAWFAIGSILLFNSILNYLPDAYPEYAASVLAGNDLMRSSFGVGFPLFASAMYSYLGVAWASSTLAFISISFIPIPFVLYRYGTVLRKRYSRHARTDI